MAIPKKPVVLALTEPSTIEVINGTSAAMVGVAWTSLEGSLSVAGGCGRAVTT